MLAHHHVMKTRDNTSAVIEGLQREHGLLAAYLCRRHRRSSFGVPTWRESTLKDAVWL
jgi:hypothetical protein